MPGGGWEIRALRGWKHSATVATGDGEGERKGIEKMGAETVS